VIGLDRNPQSRRDLLIDVAQAGDFGVFRSRRAARIAFAISAHADPATSPFPRPLFDRPAPQVEEGLYRALLDVLPRLLADVDEYRSLWGTEDAALTNTERLFAAGRVTIEEQPELDLAVVRGPSAGEWHPMAVHTRTAATRLLLVHGPRDGVPLPLRELGPDGLASAAAARRPGCAGRRDDPRGRCRRPMVLRGGRAHHPANVPGGRCVDPDARGHPPPAGGGAAGRRTGVESIRVTSDTTPGAAAVPRPGGARVGQCRPRRVPIQRRPVPAVHRRHPGAASLSVRPADCRLRPAAWLPGLGHRGPAPAARVRPRRLPPDGHPAAADHPGLPSATSVSAAARARSLEGSCSAGACASATDRPRSRTACT